MSKRGIGGHCDLASLNIRKTEERSAALGRNLRQVAGLTEAGREIKKTGTALHFTCTGAEKKSKRKKKKHRELGR